MKQSCILWEGQVAKSGYGVRYIRPRAQVYAHRAAMADIHGWDAVMGKVVMHTCDVRLCVNPEHLRIGTTAENNADMIAKGRARGNPDGAPPGERNGQAKLSNEQVAEIRRLWRERLVTTQRELAEQFGVDPSNISLIVRGRSRRRG